MYYTKLDSAQHPTTCSFARENQVKHGPCFAKCAKVGPKSTTSSNQQNMIWGYLGWTGWTSNLYINIHQPELFGNLMSSTNAEGPFFNLFHCLIWKALISYHAHKHVTLKATFGLAKSEWFMKTLWMTVILFEASTLDLSLSTPPWD